MIYLVSKQKSLFETDLYKEISFKDAKEYLWELKRIQTDTETMGLDVYTKAPVWWTEEEWNMTSEEREKVGIKLIDIEYNTDTSTHYPKILG